MTFLEIWVQSAAAKALGETLLHSLWEGAAAALVLTIALSVVRSSRVRYAAACLAMLAVLVGFGVTFYLLVSPRGGTQAVVRIPLAMVRSSSGDGPAAGVRGWEAADLLPWLAPLWMTGVLLFQLRCLASWAAAARLRRIGVCGAPDEWFARLDALRIRLRMTRPVTLLESYFAEVPSVIGHRRPVILVPVGLLAGLPVGQVEAILLHELAHIRRGDYLMNLMQTVIEGLLFYNPAVWWITSVIRAEREHCCDDLVVATSGDAHEYATALAALAASGWAVGETALAATGGNLVKRIRRLLAQPEGPRTALAPMLSAGLLVVTCGVALAAWQSPRQSAPAMPAPSAPMIESPPLAQAPTATATAPFLALAQDNRNSPAVPATSSYQKWLNEEVPYIITDQERAAFKSLQTDPERAKFIEQFWQRRDPTPGTAQNEFREEHYRRIAYANDRFGTKAILGWKTDRGRIYIEYGPADEVDSHPNGGAYTRPMEEGGGQTATYPFEQWRYRYIDGIGKNVILEFVDTARTGEYRLTMDPSEKDALLYVPGAGRVIFRFLAGSTGVLGVGVDPERKMAVTVPIEFDASQYLITVSIISTDGKTNLGSSQLASSCKASPTELGCVKDTLRTTGTTPPPGSYTYTAVVKDTASSAEKTYVVGFTVN